MSFTVNLCPPTGSLNQTTAPLGFSTSTASAMHPPPDQALLTAEREQYFISRTRQILKQIQVDEVWDAVLLKLIHDVANLFTTQLASRDQQLAAQGQQIAVQDQQLAARDQQLTALRSENSQMQNRLEKLENRSENDVLAIVHLSTALSKATTPPALPNPHPRYAGSVTRAKAWQKAISQPTSAINQDPPSTAWQGIDPRANLVLQLNRFTCDEEQNIDYPSVVHLLNTYFSPQTSLGFGKTYVLDTHERRYLNALAPDITIQRNTSSADRFNVAAVLDLKGTASGPGGKLDTANNLGQIWDYIMELVECQPGRRVFLAMLTDLKDAIIIKYTIGSTYGQLRRSSQDPGRLVQYKRTPLAIALTHLYNELTEETANPPTLPFHPGAGELVHVLQRQSNAIVAVYRSPEGITQVVKAASKPAWTESISSEINVLQLLQTPGKPKSIPELVYIHNHEVAGKLPEFGITPVGQCIHLELFKDPAEFRVCLEDVLQALGWVHERGVVHRDVRTDNVVVYQGWDAENIGEIDRKWRYRGLLIDFDRATKIGIDCVYEGGYISCPSELLQRARDASHMDLDHNNEDDGDENSPFETLLYKPRPVHDYLAFILLINTLIFPFPLRWFSYNRIEMVNSAEQKRLVRLWGVLKTSDPWRHMVDLAEQEVKELDMWRVLLEFLVWL
ncbi:hypothetical protein L211DRAFT_840975 [Terfezia boudieri ATCC MYA-4762]|uniref:non-specific serine/threonine protein kinase n=1 Tax=Terfezia boudieri ATCC MYA-4762 TaxID=1051890 RepID=A0A3N4LI53_9PEZI|nr:hypothetical protein L211DRAFT_840975 [Terfezia boudieri ATCC MYA-4762]